ncbi:hypothetical protein CR513_20651, partial [Mucuna pruriens]
MYVDYHPINAIRTSFPVWTNYMVHLSFQKLACESKPPNSTFGKVMNGRHPSRPCLVLMSGGTSCLSG